MGRCCCRPRADEVFQFATLRDAARACPGLGVAGRSWLAAAWEDLEWARRARRHWRLPWPERRPELDALIKGGPIVLAGGQGGLSWPCDFL